MINSDLSPAFAGRLALVGFSGEVGAWWLKLLKPGFRHVAVAIDDGAGGYIFYNPMLNASELVRIEGEEITVWATMHGAGFLVIATQTEEMPKKPLSFRPYNCVEGVKRALGISAPWVLTPWQLYTLIVKKNENKENNP